MRRSHELAVLGAIVLCAAWLRLGNLDLVEYKGDEALAIDLTLPLIEGRDWPKVGLVSSVGMKNPPLMMYLLALPLLVDVDPLWATGFVGLLGTLAVALTYFVLRRRFGPFVALATAALFATAPWAVLYARKIWAQDFLPIFTVALLRALFAVLERPKSWAVMALPVLACALWQLHFSAFAVLPVVGLVLLYRARQLRLTALAVGVGLASLMLVPYLHHQATHGWEDFRTLSKLAGGPGTKRPHDLRALSHTAEISGALGWSYVTGGSSPAFAKAASAARPAGRAASLAVVVLLFGGFAAAGLGLVRRARVSRRWPFLELEPDDERRGVLVLWVAGIWGSFIVARLEGVYPHYFILTYPVPFALAALALSDLCRLAPERHARIATTVAAAAVAGVCAAYLVFNLSFYRFVREQGGTLGDYGTAYRHKDEVTRFALRHGLAVGSAPPEVTQLAALRRRYPGAAPRDPQDPIPPGRFLDVRDRNRGGGLGCPPERSRSFGPLVACIRP